MQLLRLDVRHRAFKILDLHPRFSKQLSIPSRIVLLTPLRSIAHDQLLRLPLSEIRLMLRTN